MLLATTIQQAVAWVVVVILAAGGALWLLGNVRRARPEVGSELELAPNRKPYYDDDQMEGKRLDQMLWWALAALAIVAIGLPLYWLAEPGRQAGSIENFKTTFAKRGSQLFATTAEGGFNCAGCHGGVSGGQVPYTMTDPATGKLRQVLWKAPSLDDVTLRMTDDQIRYVLTYGRTFSPMPAWGLLGGGPMNDQQIGNLIEYLHSVSITPAESRKRQAANAQTELARLQNPQKALSDAQAQLAAATDSTEKLKIESEVSELQAIIAAKEEPSLGAALFNLNCARCHTLGWSFYEPKKPGSGAFGPPLTNVDNQFTKIEDHVAFVTDGKKIGEKYGRQGAAAARMPFFGQVLSKDQIQAIVDYERRLAAQEQ